MFGTCADSLLALTCEDGSPGSGVVSPDSLVFTCEGRTWTFSPGSAKAQEAQTTLGKGETICEAPGSPCTWSSECCSNWCWQVDGTCD